MIQDWNRYPNVTEAEMRCRCGCGRADMDPAFMDILQAIRTEFARPMQVTSGFRCEEHNARVGGGPEHPMGMAADIACVNPDAKRIVNLAVKYGLPRIGVAQKSGKPRFVHLGGAADLPEAIWSY